MATNITVPETKKSLSSFRSNIDFLVNPMLAHYSAEITPSYTGNWWSLYIQLLPGMHVTIEGKMKKDIRTTNTEMGEIIKFYQHILFIIIPGTFFSLVRYGTFHR